MTVAVVDRLEVIHVHDDQRQRLAETPGSFAFLLQGLLQTITVGSAGQRVALGKLEVLVELTLQLLVDPGQLPGALGHQGFQGLVLLLQLDHQAFAGVDVAVRPEHACHRAILVAGNDVAAVLDP